MSEENSGLYEFGLFRLDVGKRLLLRAGQAVPLKPKTFDLLVLVVSGRGRVLTKAELMRNLWPETFVEESNLTFQISTLRKALGDPGAEWIETVPKHGYRFAVEAAIAEPQAPNLAAATPRFRLRWIAVAVSLLLAAAMGWSFRARQPVAEAIHVDPFTTYPGVETHPSFSPDGNHVAFAWNGPEQDNWDIYAKVIGPDDTPLRLTTDPADDRFPSWSPQGGQIAFLRSGGVYLVSPLGGTERRLAYVSSVSPISWSLDGKYIYAGRAATSDEPGGIVVVPVDGGEQRRLTTAQPGLGHQNPILSPDGRSLAFLACYEGSIANCDAYVLELAGTVAAARQPRRVKGGQECVTCGLGWTSDAQSFVLGVATGAQGLWKVRADGAGTPRHVDVGPGENCWPAVSARSNRLIYSKVTSGSNIWVLERSGGTRKLADSTRHESRPQFSPDGKRVAFASDRSGLINIWVANHDGSNPVRLTPSQKYSGSPAWSPDGRWIAYDSQDDDGDWNVFVIELSGGQPRLLVNHASNDSVPSWSRNGKFIYFTSNRNGGRHEIFRMPASGGRPEQVTDAGGFVAFEAIDGQTLYYTKISGLRAAPLFARSTAGGPERQVLDSVYNRSFAVADDAIYYIEPDDTPRTFRLQSFNLSTGKQKLLTRMQGHNVSGLTVAPNEQQILYSLELRTAADLMLVENFR
jgi:Tol biopolymer transport system component/DNA-binding winged helix-turn-helix (wHTH) protein